MIRQLASRILTRSTTTYSSAALRPFSTEVAEAAFVQAWKKAVPNIDPPKTPIHYMNPRPPTSTTQTHR